MVSLQGELDGSESRPYQIRTARRVVPTRCGRFCQQIAGELGISIKTFEKHRQQVMNKLGIHDVAGLTRHAVFTGMVGGDVRQDLLSANLPATPVGVEAGPPVQHPEI